MHSLLHEVVLVRSSCYNEITIDRVAYEQQKYISYSFGAGKSLGD